MENWEMQCDKWLTTPPDEKESQFHCTDCGYTFLPHDKVYAIEGEMLCEECAQEWLRNQMSFATVEECYGY